VHTQSSPSYLSLLAITVVVAVFILLLPANLKLPAFLGISAVSLVLGVAGRSVLERSMTRLASLNDTLTQAVRALLTWLRSHITIDQRSFNFTCGVIFIGAAHYLMAQTAPVVARFTFTDALEQYYHWGMPNLDNVLLAVLMLLVSSFFLGRALIAMPEPAPSAHTAPLVYPRLSRLLRTHLSLLIVTAVLLFTLTAKLIEGDKNSILILLWLTVLGVLVFLCGYVDRKTHVPLSFRLERRDVALMLVIFVAGLAISTFQLDTLPNSIVGDEGAFLQRAQIIARNQETQSFFDTGVYSFPLAGSFYQGLIVKLFGESLWS